MKLFRIPKKKPQRILSNEEELEIREKIKSIDIKKDNEEAYLNRYTDLLNNNKDVSIKLTPEIRGLMAQYYLMGLKRLLHIYHHSYFLHKFHHFYILHILNLY